MNWKLSSITAESNIIAKFDGVVVFVPHVTHCGKPDARALAHSIKEESLAPPGRVVSVEGEYTAQELKSVIGLSSVFIGALMHTLIAAVSQGIPSIGIGYSSKTKDLLSSVGLGDYAVDIRSIHPERLCELLDDIWINRERIADRLGTEARALRHDALMSGKLLRALVCCTEEGDRGG